MNLDRRVRHGTSITGRTCHPGLKTHRPLFRVPRGSRVEDDRNDAAAPSSYTSNVFVKWLHETHTRDSNALLLLVSRSHHRRAQQMDRWLDWTGLGLVFFFFFSFRFLLRGLPLVCCLTMPFTARVSNSDNRPINLQFCLDAVLDFAPCCVYRAFYIFYLLCLVAAYPNTTSNLTKMSISLYKYTLLRSLLHTHLISSESTPSIFPTQDTGTG